MTNVSLPIFCTGPVILTTAPLLFDSLITVFLLLLSDLSAFFHLKVDCSLDYSFFNF